jgi:hypothetical protein
MVIAQSQRLRTRTAALRDAWGVLLIRFRENLGAVTLAGGSDATAVVDLVLDRQACLPCLIRGTATSEGRVSEMLTDVLRRFVLRVFDGICDDCHHLTIVHRLTTDGTSAN